jgi:SAM-dependent MidA family methyltransferase
MAEIAKIIKKAVEEQGVIPFKEFMRLALYCPDYGYYEQAEGQIGSGGDYYTNVSIGSLFGELLAFQFARWLDKLPGPVQLVEAGAHDGRLARDILCWLATHEPGLFERAEYWIIEPSLRREGWQKQALKEFAPKVRWFESITQLPDPVSGVTFSNELLDAFPVHRLGWDAQMKRWFEWGVALDADGTLVWRKIPRQPDYFARELRQAALETPAELAAVLPDEFTIELCTEAAAWWQQAASCLEEGKLLTVDYGLSAEQLLAPSRAAGTLRAYRGHTLNKNLLADPGGQDLTGHVNFTQLQRAGEAAGLTTEALLTQEQFLTGIAARIWAGEKMREWTSSEKRQFQTLVHPEHLGRPFSVLVQAKVE